MTDIILPPAHELTAGAPALPQAQETAGAIQATAMQATAGALLR